MQFISNDKTVRSNNTVQDFRNFNLDTLVTQAKKGEQMIL